MRVDQLSGPELCQALGNSLLMYKTPKRLVSTTVMDHRDHVGVTRRYTIRRFQIGYDDDDWNLLPKYYQECQAVASQRIPPPIYVRRSQRYYHDREVSFIILEGDDVIYVPIMKDPGTGNFEVDFNPIVPEEQARLGLRVRKGPELARHSVHAAIPTDIQVISMVTRIRALKCQLERFCLQCVSYLDSEPYDVEETYTLIDRLTYDNRRRPDLGFLLNDDEGHSTSNDRTSHDSDRRSDVRFVLN